MEGEEGRGVEDNSQVMGQCDRESSSVFYSDKRWGELVGFRKKVNKISFGYVHCKLVV